MILIDILSTRSLGLGRKLLATLPAANRSPRLCAECGARVTDADPFIRYHGEYFHASVCAESNPPALRHRLALADGTVS
jgi:hypothetical protein